MRSMRSTMARNWSPATSTGRLMVYSWSTRPGKTPLFAPPRQDEPANVVSSRLTVVPASLEAASFSELIEVSQVRRRLIAPRRHEVTVAADEIVLRADLVVMV